MRTLALLLLTTVAAAAADIPIKAPTLAGYPYDKSGFYWGISTWGGGGHVNGTLPGIDSAALVTNQMGIGGTVGYTWGNINYFYALEGTLGITNINGQTAGLSMQGPMSFMVRGKAGTPLGNFLSMFPDLGLPAVPPFPTLPNGQVATNVHTYLFAGAKGDDVSANFGNMNQKDWRVMPVIGVGMMGQLTKGVAADVWAGTAFPSKAVCIGGVACGGEGQQILVGFGLLY